MYTLLNTIRLHVEALNQCGYKKEADELFKLINKLEAEEFNKVALRLERRKDAYTIKPPRIRKADKEPTI